MNGKPSFFAELKRRNVYKVAVAYAVVGWLLVQIATQVFPFLEIPNWVVRLVIALVVIGFPIAFVIAWAFELTSEGIKRTEDVDLATQERTKSHTWIYVVIIAVLLSVGLFSVGRYTASDRVITSGLRENSLAVMPFENASGNADMEYLSDGMTDTLISTLSQLPKLNVKARSSVFRYKGKGTGAVQIAKELNVQLILNGRVVQRGDQLTLTLELVNAQTENVIWSEQYNRKQADLMTLQSEIARDVSSKLKIKLSGEDEAKLAKTHTANPDAYQLYLKGRYHATGYTEEGFKKGIEYFNQAIAIDPAYAQAYDGLAYCYSSSWYIPAKEGGPKGKAAAMKALEIDPMLAEAHSSLGAIYAWYDYDWAASEKEFRRAIELNPNYGLAHGYYGIYLAAMSRFDEAIGEAKRAVQLEPLSAELNTMLGIVYFYAKRYDLASEQLNKTIEFEPNFWWAHTFLARTYENSSKLPAAIAELERAKLMEGATIEVLAALGHAYAASGKRNEALKIISDLKGPANLVQSDGYEIAVINAALGEKDQAFAYLNKEYATGAWYLNFVKVDPYLDPLRGDPRFKEMLKRLNLLE